MKLHSDWQQQAVSPAEAVAVIQSGHKVFIHGACATPLPLVEALSKRRDVEGVDVYHLHISGPAYHVSPELQGRIRAHSLFSAANIRGAVNEGLADHIPIFLSEIGRAHV